MLLSLLAALLIGSAAAAPPAECHIGDDPPPYYAIDLVTTKKVPGARLATGTADVVFARSPFGIALTPEGEYIYELRIKVDKLRPARSGKYVAWVTTPSLDERRRLGALDENHQVTGRVDWNKFLVVVTLEEDEAEGAATWEGPVVVRGMSRSGFMHTQAGHGPFETEPCAVYGY
ncbi:MAG: hypothetical protein JJ896_02855 [Rhodothermales bacterium]|nr:hypothetical protein [Rhodothermales bacterium]MBO6778571.1 hypothetical protein [Rhodothermales bacterium]